MSTNDKVLLETVLADRASQWEGSPPPDDEAFELFCLEVLMKDADLSADEVLAGQIGGGGDGGIDGLYCLLDGALLEGDAEVLSDDFDHRKVEKGAEISLICVQAKQTASFSETAIQLISDTLNSILNLEVEDDDLEELFSADLVGRAEIFRRVWRQLAPRHPNIRVQVHYATKGDVGQINKKVHARADVLTQEAEKVSSRLNARLTFSGARELLELDALDKPYTLSLPYVDMIASDASHVMLVRLDDYMSFISENGTLRKHIFDWNVRDFEGEVEVNKEIAASLADGNSPEFWWLNNGITIICSEASSANKICSMDDVQVVNGLQSSVSIFNHLSSASEDDAARQRLVLVRVIATRDAQARDRIVRATNRQTAVQQASLRASDPIQRDLEKFFLSEGWFYERRKNYYRNQAKPPAKIVAIPYLAQAVLASGFSEPSNSRARPSSLLKRDEDYERIFDPTIPYPVFLWVASVQKEVDAFLRAVKFGQRTETNLRFHVAMIAVANLLEGRAFNPKQLSHLTDSVVDANEMTVAARFVIDSFDPFFAASSSADGSIDRAVKSQAFSDFLLAQRFPDASDG